MVATAKTVYSIVRYFEQTAADAGIKPQQVRVQASRLAYRIDIHRDSVTSALNEDYLGFTKVEGYWMVAKEYDWKAVKECFESNYNDVVKLAVWREQKDISVAPVGDNDLVRTTNTPKVVNKKCDKPHWPDYLLVNGKNLKELERPPLSHLKTVAKYYEDRNDDYTDDDLKILVVVAAKELEFRDSERTKG